MDFLDRVEVSDWISGISGLLLFISVFLRWYSVKVLGTFIGGASGWDASKLTLIIWLAAILVVVIVVLRILDVDLSMIPVPMGVVVMALGAVSCLIVVLRMFIHQEGLGISYGIFISLIASIGVIVGGVFMQREGIY